MVFTEIVDDLATTSTQAGNVSITFHRVSSNLIALSASTMANVSRNSSAENSMVIIYRDIERVVCNVTHPIRKFI